MKEKVCYVAYDVAQEQKLAVETTVLVETYTVSMHFTSRQQVGGAVAGASVTEFWVMGLIPPIQV